VFDNVVAIELRAIAGALYPLIDPTFTPDGAAGILYDVVNGTPDPNKKPDPGTPDILPTPPASVSYLDRFPYLNHPVSGYQVTPLSAPAA